MCKRFCDLCFCILRTCMSILGIDRGPLAEESLQRSHTHICVQFVHLRCEPPFPPSSMLRDHEPLAPDAGMRTWACMTRASRPHSCWSSLNIGLGVQEGRGRVHAHNIGASSGAVPPFSTMVNDSATRIGLGAQGDRLHKLTTLTRLRRRPLTVRRPPPGVRRPPSSVRGR